MDKIMHIVLFLPKGLYSVIPNVSLSPEREGNDYNEVRNENDEQRLRNDGQDDHDDGQDVHDDGQDVHGQVDDGR
jgi:hypothetical protein